MATNSNWAELLSFAETQIKAVAPQAKVFTAFSAETAAKLITTFPSIAICFLSADFDGSARPFPIIKSAGEAFFSTIIFTQNATDLGAGRQEAFELMASIRNALIGKFPTIFTRGYPIVARREEVDEVNGTTTIVMATFSVHVQMG